MCTGTQSAYLNKSKLLKSLHSLIGKTQKGSQGNHNFLMNDCYSYYYYLGN